MIKVSPASLETCLHTALFFRTFFITSYVEECEDSGLLGYDDVSLGHWFLKFRSIVMPSS